MEADHREGHVGSESLNACLGRDKCQWKGMTKMSLPQRPHSMTRGKLLAFLFALVSAKIVGALANIQGGADFLYLERNLYRSIT